MFQRCHGRAAWRGNHVFELSWVQLLLIKQRGSAGQRAVGEMVSLIARQSSSNSTIGHRLGDQSHIGRT